MVQQAFQAGDDRVVQHRIRLRIPRQYHQEPIISRLVSDYALTVNIAAALLGSNARDDGWFDLDLRGTAVNIESALTYLNDLNLELWNGTEPDGW